MSDEYVTGQPVYDNATGLGGMVRQHGATRKWHITVLEYGNPSAPGQSPEIRWFGEWPANFESIESKEFDSPNAALAFIVDRARSGTLVLPGADLSHLRRQVSPTPQS